MKRRICLAGVALCALPLATGVATATAARPKPKHLKPAAKLAVTCSTKVGIVPANGESSVTPPVQQGSEYGTARCTKLLGKGIQSDSFNVSDGGDTVATFTWYLKTGTVSGKFDLTPQEGSLNFLNVTYSGTMTITGGTGTFRGVTGTGKMACASTDGVHTDCTDKLKLGP